MTRAIMRRVASRDAAHDDARHDCVPRHGERFLKRGEADKQEIYEQVRSDQQRGREVSRREAVHEVGEGMVGCEAEGIGRCVAGVGIGGVFLGEVCCCVARSCVDRSGLVAREEGEAQAGQLPCGRCAVGVEDAPVQVVAQNLAGKVQPAELLNDGERKWKSCGDAERRGAQDVRRRETGTSFEARLKRNVEEGEGELFGQKRRVAWRQGVGPVILDGLGQRREQEIEDKEEEGREQEEDEADGKSTE